MGAGVDRVNPGRVGRPRRPKLLLYVLAIPLVPIAGCTVGSTDGPSYAITDSSGVEIVHSVRPAWSAETAWSVMPEPRLEIGRRSGADPYMLDRVMGVKVLDDGGVAVAQLADNTIRFYDAEGVFVRKVGGQGGGPQEFRQIAGLQRHHEELWGSQFGRSPTKVFDQSGTFLRVERAEIPIDMRGGRLHGVFGDGSLVIADWPQADQVEGQPVIGMSTLVRQIGGRTDTLAVVPAVRILPWPHRPGGVYQEFSPKLTLAVAGDRLYHAFPEDFEIIVRDTTGAIRRIIRRDWDPEPVTKAHIARYEEALLGLAVEGGREVPSALRERRQRVADAQIHPEHHPAFERLVLARGGHIWTERTDPDNLKAPAGWHTLRDTPTTWDVFDPAGVWLGSVELPPRFLAYDVGTDYVAGIWKDGVDVEFVRVYDLDKGEG